MEERKPEQGSGVHKKQGRRFETPRSHARTPDRKSITRTNRYYDL